MGPSAHTSGLEKILEISICRGFYDIHSEQSEPRINSSCGYEDMLESLTICITNHSMTLKPMSDFSQQEWPHTWRQSAVIA